MSDKEEKPGVADPGEFNNILSHEYRELSDEEKSQVRVIKDLGVNLYNHLDSLGAGINLDQARARLRESIFWAVAHITR